VYLCVGIP